jgi:hypothetical protein
MQIRRGTATAWATADPTLVAGELGFVTDTGKTAFKIGDGTNPWTTLPYVNATYPELPVDAGLNLDNSYVQGRYALLTGVTYTNAPPAADFNGTTTDGSSILLVTVPSSTIVIQELTTSLTPCKRFIRARATTSAWTAWKRLDTLSATESLSITNLTLTGTLTIPAGAVTTPSLRFAAAANTGIYSTGANNLTVTTGGADRVSVGTVTTTVSTDLTVTGIVAANVAGTGTALSVNTGTTQLKTTVVNGLLQVSAATPANKFTVGSIRSGTVGLTEIYLNSSPYLRVSPTTGAAASDLVWTGTNAAGSATTTIRCDGVPTNASDLTHKSYVDTQVAGVTFREIMYIGMATNSTDGNYTVGGTIVTGVVAGSTAVRLALTSGGAPTFTYVSNNASSTVTWTTFSSGSRYHLVPSAGTWSVACPPGGLGIVFQAIRTA